MPKRYENQFGTYTFSMINTQNTQHTQKHHPNFRCYAPVQNIHKHFQFPVDSFIQILRVVLVTSQYSVVTLTDCLLSLVQPVADPGGRGAMAPPLAA